MAIAPISVGDVESISKINQAIAKANLVDGKADQAALTAESAARVAADNALAAEIEQNREDLARDFSAGNWSRPGEAAMFWTHQIEGAPGDLSPISPSLVRIDSEGNIVRITGANKIGPIRAYRIEAGRLYRVRFAVRRRVNAADPANHTVRLAVRWLSRGKGALPTAMTVVQDLNSFVVASGRTIVTKVISTAAGTGVDIVAPAGAVYLRPYGQTYGDDGTTDFEIIDLVDITDAINFSPDVSGLESRMSEQESIDAGVRLDEIESQLGGAEIRDYLTRATVTAATISNTVNAIRVMQYDLMTPLAPAVFERAAVEPEHVEKIQSSDGAWWVLSRAQEICPETTGFSFGDAGADRLSFQRALNTGLNVRLTPGRIYDVDGLLYATKDRQLLVGYNAIVRNNVNDEPLWCFGNPYDANGAVEFAGVEGVEFQGRIGGATLWGVYVPTAFDTVDGCNSNVSNIYASRGHANWVKAARGCFLNNTRIRYVYGGYALHVSAWDFEARKTQLWSGKRGLRNIGDCNANRYELYISSMGECGIEQPNATGGGAKNTHYLNCIVQQCGWDGFGSISLRSGEGTRVANIYLERNDEKGGNVDIYLGVSESNIVVDGVTHKLEVDDGQTQTIIRCNAHNATVRNVDWRNQILYGLDLISTVASFGARYENIKARNAIAGLEVEAIHIANPSIAHLGVGKDNRGWNIGPHFVGRGDPSTGATDKMVVRQGRSTAGYLQLESVGSMRFVTDVGNVTSSGDFEWRHNGEDALGALLLRLAVANGAFLPGSDNTQPFGGPTARWSQGWFGTIHTFPPASVTPTVNGEVTHQLTSNTQLTFRVKGSDGVVRSGSITLA